MGFVIVCGILFVIWWIAKQSPNFTHPISINQKSDNEISPMASVKAELLQVFSPVHIEKPRLTKQTSNGIKWHKKGEELEIRGYKINGLVYTSGRDSVRRDIIRMNAKVYQECDPSHEIGYFPSYNNLTQSQRACYLKFLQDGPSSNTNVGYAFLYLYGLEYHLIYEEAMDEYNDIVHEVMKLREAFAQNSSFECYSSNLLAHAFLLKSKNGDITQNLDYSSIPLKHQIVLDVIIAELTLKECPIPAELVYNYISRYPSRVVIKRCAEEFKKVFIDVFYARYSKGYKCKMKKRELTPEYHLCSRDFYKETYKKLPNIAGDSFSSKFDSIIDEACNVLAKYSKFVINGERDSLYAKALLPLNFIQNDESVKEYFANIGLGTFQALQIAQLFLSKDSLSPTEFQNVSDFHNKFGFACTMNKAAQTTVITTKEQDSATEPVKISEGDIANGFSIPKKQNHYIEEKIFLGARLIKQKTQETRDVVSALSSVFKEDEVIIVRENKVDDGNDPTTLFLKIVH